MAFISNTSSLQIRGATKYIIEKLMYFPVKSYVPVPIRPYSFGVTSEAVDHITSKMAKTQSSTFRPETLAGDVCSIVQPATVSIDSNIDHTWVTTRRFIFMMKVKTLDGYTGTTINTYIQGYTEYDGISQNGAIDPQLRHIINNVIETSTATFNTPLGVKTEEKLCSIYNVISGSNFYNNDVYLQRPTDICATIELTNLTEVMGDESVMVQSAANTLSAFNRNVASISNANGVTAEYLSRVLTGTLQTVKAGELNIGGSDDGYMQSYMSPGVKQTEAGIENADFIHFLSRMNGNRVVKNDFLFSNLLGVDPTIQDRFILYRTTQDYTNPVSQQTPEVGDYWHGQDMETVKAYSLIENSVAMAVKYGFTRITFSVSNTTPPMFQPYMVIMDYSSYMTLSEQYFVSLLDMFRDDYLQNIYMNECDLGRISLNLECHIDLLGTSKIYLEYAGQYGRWFTIPTFANSEFSPVLTYDADMLNYAAEQVSSLATSVAQCQDKPFYY